MFSFTGSGVISCDSDGEDGAVFSKGSSGVGGISVITGSSGIDGISDWLVISDVSVVAGSSVRLDFSGSTGASSWSGFSDRIAALSLAASSGIVGISRVSMISASALSEVVSPVVTGGLFCRFFNLTYYLLIYMRAIRGLRLYILTITEGTGFFL